MVILILLCWLASAVLTYGLTVAYFSREYPAVSDIREDRGIGVYLALFSPFSLLAVFLISGFGKHGLRF